MHRFTPAFVARFKRRLAQRGDCLEWNGCITVGYGAVGVRCLDGVRTHQKLRAHRVAWEIAHNTPPTGVVRHTCDNRICCNPAHLIDGTQKENIQDSIIKGRFSFPPILRGEAHGEAVLTEAEVHEIRRRRTNGEKLIAIAREFGISESLVGVITRGEGWTDVAFREDEHLFKEPRRQHLATDGNQTLSIAEWSRRTGLRRDTIRKRLERGWDEQEAVSRPARKWTKGAL